MVNQAEFLKKLVDAKGDDFSIEVTKNIKVNPVEVCGYRIVKTRADSLNILLSVTVSLLEIEDIINSAKTGGR